MRAELRPTLALLLLATPALADDLAATQLATCAALWHVQADAFPDGASRDLAQRFEAAAILAAPDDAEALVAERRPWVADLLAAYVHASDEQSRDLYTRLLTTCARLEADLP